MQELTIQSETKKGRAFSATMLGCIVANQLWNEGSTNAAKVSRPIWASFANTEAELRAFIANLRMGRKAQTTQSGYRWNHNTFEFLRSVKYRIAWQKHPEGSICTLFLPDLFILDPGTIDPEIKFVLLPSQETLQSNAITIERPETLLLYPKYGSRFSQAEVALATLFSIMLSRRIKLPYPTDPRFFVLLFWACQERGFLRTLEKSYDSYRDRIKAESHGSFSDMGFYPPMVFLASQEEFSEFLADLVAAYL